MSTPNISADLSDADKDKILDMLDRIFELLPFLAHLDPTARRKLRKTGSKREGYVQDVYEGAIANPDSIPASFDLNEWTRDEQLNVQLGDVQERVNSLAEAISDTRLLLGNERIHQADQAYGHLKQSSRGNSALNTLTKRISRQFAGQGREGRKTTFTVSGGGQVTVTDVSTSTQFVNIGTTELKVYKGETATVKAQPVLPGEALTLDSDATTITVTNMSADNTVVNPNGVFTVKLKAARK